MRVAYRPIALDAQRTVGEVAADHSTHATSRSASVRRSVRRCVVDAERREHAGPAPGTDARNRPRTSLTRPIKEIRAIGRVRVRGSAARPPGASRCYVQAQARCALLPAPTPRVKGASPIAHVSGSPCPSRARRVDASCDLRRRPARTRGVAPEVSAQRGTSGATNGGGGPQAPPSRTRCITQTSISVSHDPGGVSVHLPCA